MKDRCAALIVFLLAIGLYVFTAAPHLAPYRDSGEMVCVIKTLGVAHPPGYPLYTLLGRISSLLGMGTAAYQLNIFSGFCGALTLVVLYFTLRRWMPLAPAFFAALFTGISQPFWELSVVSEMYALGVLWLALILFSYFYLENEIFLMFLLGLGLGVRMDLLLLIPIFVFFLWRSGRSVSWVLMGAALGAGASIYFYLTIRSGRNPWMDWGNPDTILATFASASRKSYSGTLDLLSLSYKSGENFVSSLYQYGLLLVRSFGIALILLLIGVARSWSKHRRVSLLLLTMFAVMGPVFLYLANMPPNPHSLAILEASYLFPNFVLTFFVAFGLAWLFDGKPQRWVALALLIVVPVQTVFGLTRESKRNNFYLRDYLTNVLRSLPPHAIAVFHDDVQLFSLWEAQLIGRHRGDVSLISSGLSGSPWYWDMKKHWPTSASPDVSVKEPAGWPELKRQAANRPVVMGYDVDYSEAPGLKIFPCGAVCEVGDASAQRSPRSEVLLKYFFVRRNLGAYGDTPDFFSSDLISDEARAFHQHGFQATMAGDPQGPWYFRVSTMLDPTFVRPWSDMAYFFLQKNQLPQAEAACHRAIALLEDTIRMSRDYKSLPEVVQGIKSDYAAVYTHLGVVYERSGRLEEARNAYIASVNVMPNAQAYYNLAVTYWGHDWEKAAQAFGAALQINPQMPEARAYFERARQAVAAHAPTH